MFRSCLGRYTHRQPGLWSRNRRGQSNIAAGENIGLIVLAYNVPFKGFKNDHDH